MLDQEQILKGGSFQCIRGSHLDGTDFHHILVEGYHRLVERFEEVPEDLGSIVTSEEVCSEGVLCYEEWGSDGREPGDVLINVCAGSTLRDVADGFFELGEENVFECAPLFFSSEFYGPSSVQEKLHRFDPGNIVKEPPAGGEHEEGMPL